MILKFQSFAVFWSSTLVHQVVGTTTMSMSNLNMWTNNNTNNNIVAGIASCLNTQSVFTRSTNQNNNNNYIQFIDENVPIASVGMDSVHIQPNNNNNNNNNTAANVDTHTMNTQINVENNPNDLITANNTNNITVQTQLNNHNNIPPLIPSGLLNFASNINSNVLRQDTPDYEPNNRTYRNNRKRLCSKKDTMPCTLSSIWLKITCGESRKKLKALVMLA